jgi:hypothetical protein
MVDSRFSIDAGSVESCVVVKAELKARKEDARIMIEEMEQMGRDLASRK